MSVDLPEPEGPQTTTTSPFSTDVEQFFRTWKEPYHLLTFLISIIAMGKRPLLWVSLKKMLVFQA